MTRDQLIHDMARLLCGLQVPISLHMPMGAAIEPWESIFNSVHGFGWATVEEIEVRFRDILDNDALSAS